MNIRSIRQQRRSDGDEISDKEENWKPFNWYKDHCKCDRQIIFLWVTHKIFGFRWRRFYFGLNSPWLVSFLVSGDNFPWSAICNKIQILICRSFISGKFGKDPKIIVSLYIAGKTFKAFEERRPLRSSHNVQGIRGKAFSGQFWGKFDLW